MGGGETRTNLLAEPSPFLHKKLKKNRPNCKIVTEYIYSETGKNLDFFVSDAGVFSTLEQFRQSDISLMPNNTKVRNKMDEITRFHQFL